MTLVELLNQNPGEVKDVFEKDGKTIKYQYVPISVVQDSLDEIFEYNWSFDLDREEFGKHSVSAKGTLTVNYKNEKIIVRAGVAAMKYEDSLKLDYPSLKTHVLLNAAKSLGRVLWPGT